MIRWNIQTPAIRRQACWCMIILSCGLFFFFYRFAAIYACADSLFWHVNTHVYADIHSIFYHLAKVFDLWPKDGVKGIHSKVFGGEKKWWRDSQNNNLAIDFCSVQKGAAKSCAAREGLIPRLDEQIVNNMTYTRFKRHIVIFTASQTTTKSFIKMTYCRRPIF